MDGDDQEGTQQGCWEWRPLIPDLSVCEKQSGPFCVSLRPIPAHAVASSLKKINLKKLRKIKMKKT